MTGAASEIEDTLAARGSEKLDDPPAPLPDERVGAVVPARVPFPLRHPTSPT